MVEAVLIDNKIRQSSLRWSRHVISGPERALVRKSEKIYVGMKRKSKGKPLKTWIQAIQKDVCLGKSFVSKRVT